jgi:hypothetical protein
MEKYKKYKNSFRLLVIQASSRSNDKYKLVREILNDNIEELNKRNVKILSDIDDDLTFKVQLIGYDGTLKKTYNFNIGKSGGNVKENYQKQIDKIIKYIDNMPMSKNDEKKDTKGLSLYTGSTSGKSIEGLGFKNKEKALYTIDKIKNEPIAYQKSVVNTMHNRAKYHPNQTKDMKGAMTVYSKWIKTKKLEQKKSNKL